MLGLACSVGEGDGVAWLFGTYTSSGVGVAVGAGGGLLADASVGYVMLFNILHAAEPDRLVREAYRILAPGGTAAVTHWTSDRPTPRGPSMAIRPRPDDCRAWMIDQGFNTEGPIELPPFHFGFIGRKV